MSLFRLSFVCLAFAACSPDKPEGERWAFASGAPTEDGCGLADAGFTAIEGKWFHELGIDDVAWRHEDDGRPHPAFACEVRGAEFSCLGSELGLLGDRTVQGWLRGSYAPDGRSVSGEMTVVNVCGAQLCGDGVNGFYKPCRSVVPVSAGLLEDTYVGACPPGGTKSVRGAPAIVKLMKGSRADSLRLSELDENGEFREGGVLPTAEGEVNSGMQTNIGVWFILHTKAGTHLQCVGAFEVTAPEMRVVIR